MTKEDKERIEHMASKPIFAIGGAEAFIRGANYEHPIAFNKGFNEGVEACKKHIGNILERASFMDDYRDGLEKLKKPILSTSKSD